MSDSSIRRFLCPVATAWLLALLALFSIELAVVAQDTKPPRQQTPARLNNFAEIEKQVRRTDVDTLPIEIDVWVNYWDRRDSTVFIENAYDAKYVDVTSRHFGAFPQLAPGTKLHVIGEMILKGNYVRADSIRVSEEKAEVVDRPVRFSTLALGDLWGHRIRCQAVVEEVARLGSSWRAALRSDEKILAVHRFDETGDYRWPLLIGKQVDVTGTLQYLVDFNGRPIIPEVRTNEFDAGLQEIHSAEADVPQLLDSPGTPTPVRIASLNGEGDVVGNHLKLHGQISAVVDHKGYLIEGDGGSVYVRSKLATKSARGHVVDLTVRRQADEFQVMSLQSVGIQSIPPPRCVEAASLELQRLPCRASLEAEYISSYSQGERRIVMLRDGGTVFAAIVDAHDHEWNEIDLDDARHLAVSGMATATPDWLKATTDSDAAGLQLNPSFVIELPSPMELQIVSRWWQLSSFYRTFGLSVIALVCTLGMICFATLWVRVQHINRTNRRLEFQLVQSQKMDALGRLAGGVAHDFNNLLTGISSNLELLQRDPENFDPRYEQCIASARHCTSEATKLVRSLLGFSRQTNLELEPGDINTAVENAALLAKTSLGPNVAITLDLSRNLLPCRFDKSQLEQVLLNLCFNARDALPNHSGTVHLKTNQRVNDDQQPYVEVHVRDSGHGMSEQTRERVFEPFFTTKRVGEGTGLGLSLAYGIIQQHGGSIECESVQGVGSVFTIALPGVSPDSLWASPESQLKSTSTEERSADKTPVKTIDDVASVESKMRQDGDVDGDSLLAEVKNESPCWKILLIDDDSEVRRITELCFETLGHQVTGVSDGLQGVRMVQQGHPFDVVVLDLVMPTLSGSETFCKIKSAQPQLPIVVCSGLLIELETLEKISGQQPDACLAKPFQLRELQEALAKAMGPITSAAV